MTQGSICASFKLGTKFLSCYFFRAVFQSPWMIRTFPPRPRVDLLRARADASEAPAITNLLPRQRQQQQQLLEQQVLISGPRPWAELSFSSPMSCGRPDTGACLRGGDRILSHIRACRRYVCLSICPSSCPPSVVIMFFGDFHLLSSLDLKKP